MKQSEIVNRCKMLDKVIPDGTIQLFLPLYLKHPAAVKLRSAGIFMCGVSDTTPGFLIRRIPDFLFAIFTVRGCGQIRIDGKKYELTADSLFLAPQWKEQEYFQHGDGNWKFLWFHFMPDAGWLKFPLEEPALGKCRDAAQLENALNGFSLEVVNSMQSLQSISEQPIWTFYRDSLPLRDTLDMFHLRIDDYAFLAEELAELHAGIIIGYLKREIQSFLMRFDADEIRDRLENLWKTVLGDLGRNWTLGDLAALVNMSIPTLIRQVKKQHDATPMQMLYHFRLKRATQLLLSSQLSMTAVSTEIGYENMCSFSTAFRKEYGLSPREYRKRYMN